jgi:MoaA/NifB/PqqE/SkfB family radical SAM enzyme
MEKISVLTLGLTEKCNFSCPYCPQTRGKKALTIEAISDFLDFLKPRLAEDVWLGFYGGEPLLAWPLVEKTVERLRKSRKSKFHFTLTTNGSLLKKKHILFLRENRFEMVLSCDGLAQARRDPGSVVAVEKALAGLKELYPGGYTVNSVFTPVTVSLLAASMEKMLERGDHQLRYSLDLSVPWRDDDLAALENQLDRLAKVCLEHRRKTGSMPLENLEDDGQKGIFACFAGRDRLALLPDNTVWGCYLFYDLLGHHPEHPDYRKYCFGKLEDFVADLKKDFPVVAAHYRDLRQDYFFTAKKELCSLCPELENCSVCPIVAALATSQLAVIPTWTCRVKALQARFRARLAAVH